MSQDRQVTDELEELEEQAEGRPGQENISTRLNFVCSYPKSGNTWVRLGVAAYALGAEGLDQFVRHDDIGRIHFQSASIIPISDIGVGAEAQLRGGAMLALAREANSKDGPTLVKSHHACSRVNDIHLWSRQWTRRVVNPIRDPRDVCCSVKDHFGMDSYMEAAEFMNNSEANIGGDEKLHHILGSWSNHVSSWLNTERVPVHTVKYEDLHENDIQEFKQILEFLGIEDIDGERLETSTEAVRFENMQETEEKYGFPERSSHQDRFFRKGEAGGWRDELPSEVQKKIEEDHGEIMEELYYL